MPGPSDPNDPNYDPELDPTSGKYNRAKAAAYLTGLGIKPTGTTAAPGAPAAPQTAPTTPKGGSGGPDTYRAPSSGTYFDTSTNTWKSGTAPPVRPSYSTPLPLAEIQNAYHSGSIDRATALQMLTDKNGSVGYSPNDAGIALDTLDKVKAQGSLNPSDFTNAYAQGHLDDHAFLAAVTNAGVAPDQANVLLDLAQDAKTKYDRAQGIQSQQDALRPAQDANTAAGLAKAQQQRDYDSSHVMGGTSQFDQKPSDQITIGGYKSGQYDRNMAKSKLMASSDGKAGYSAQDAETLLQSADNTQPAQQKQSIAPTKNFGSAGSVNAAGGTKEMHPQARQTVNDFRSNFASNLQALGPAVTPAAREWAMSNQDMFFQPGSDSGAVGASQIQNLYEGMGSAGPRARYSPQGGGIQARSL